MSDTAPVHLDSGSTPAMNEITHCSVNGAPRGKFDRCPRGDVASCVVSRVGTAGANRTSDVQVVRTS